MNRHTGRGFARVVYKRPDSPSVTLLPALHSPWNHKGPAPPTGRSKQRRVISQFDHRSESSNHQVDPARAGSLTTASLSSLEPITLLEITYQLGRWSICTGTSHAQARSGDVRPWHPCLATPLNVLRPPNHRRLSGDRKREENKGHLNQVTQ